jgi:DNA-binding transcriptional ArsR family regulator
MITDHSIAPVGALLADSARVAILLALADGRPRPAGDLARMAGIKPSTASEHLSRLLAGQLVVVEPQGRHRYYRIAGAQVVSLLEALGAHAQPSPPSGYRELAAARSVRHARACYDHLAGALGVQVTSALVDRGVLVAVGQAFEVPPEGSSFLTDQLGIDVTAARASRRQFAKACLDWTERQHHVAGALGFALLSRFLELQWLERTESSRALRVTSAGRRGFRDVLDVDALEARYG